MLSTLPLRLLLMGSLLMAASEDSEWKCPEFDNSKISCSCDFPHTLRCLTDRMSLPLITKKLQTLKPAEAVSLLDCTVQNLTTLPGLFLEGVALHGLVITSGEITEISEKSFSGLLYPLQALGLPNNQLDYVPTMALKELYYLERLDLSHNKLSSLNSSSFNGLTNLTFLDLSDNQLINSNPDVFSSLKNLETLKLRGNRLSVSTISNLKFLNSLIELDLSTNALIGPLDSKTVPEMPSLKTLLLANNQFNSICQDALRGASSLLSLSLNHNQIDVLEDHAFREVKSLRSLDLANNRIVAISGSSLAHLTKLVELDLSHNFLRALTSDVTAPLSSLRELRLDDNDISLVASDALTDSTPLEKLTLSDNPLNCDCTLADFASWFNNASRMSMADRSTAVCATPPDLENALLMEIRLSELRCEDDSPSTSSPMASVASGNQVMLRAFHFNGRNITLLWSVDSKANPFTCDAIFVYEEMSSHEVLLSSTPLRCNSSQLTDPTTLIVSLPVESMQLNHRYRYCVVLLQSDKRTDEMQLVLGCSEVISLVITSQSLAQPPRITLNTRIASLHANFTYDVLSVTVVLWNQKKSMDPQCHIIVTVFMMNSFTSHHLNCSHPQISISGLPPSPYHVCATLGNYPPAEPTIQCITVNHEQLKTGGSVVLTVCFILLSTLILLGVYLVFRKISRRPKLTTHQCFLAPDETDDEKQRKKHSRYVKLQATTRL